MVKGNKNDKDNSVRKSGKSSKKYSLKDLTTQLKSWNETGDEASALSYKANEVIFGDWDFDSFPGASWLDYAVNSPTPPKTTTTTPTPLKKTATKNTKDEFDFDYCSLQVNKEISYKEAEHKLAYEQLTFSQEIKSMMKEDMAEPEEEHSVTFDQDWNALTYNSDTSDDDESDEDVKSEQSWGQSAENRGWVDYTSPEQEVFELKEAEEKNAMIEFEKDKEEFVPSVDVGLQCDLGDEDEDNEDENASLDNVLIEMMSDGLQDIDATCFEDDDCEVLILEDNLGPHDSENLTILQKVNAYNDEPWIASMFECAKYISTSEMKARVRSYTFTGVGVAPCTGDQFRQFADFLDAGMKAIHMSPEQLPTVYLGCIYAKGGFGKCDVILTNSGEVMWNKDTELRLVYGSDCGIVGETKVHIGCVDAKENVLVEMNFGKMACEGLMSEGAHNNKRGLSIWALCSGGEIFGTALAVNRV